jgi:hypothetical protein
MILLPPRELRYAPWLRALFPAALALLLVAQRSSHLPEIYALPSVFVVWGLVSSWTRVKLTDEGIEQLPLLGLARRLRWEDITGVRVAYGAITISDDRGLTVRAHPLYDGFGWVGVFALLHLRNLPAGVRARLEQISARVKPLAS